MLSQLRLLLVTAFAVLALPSIAQAQFTIQFGISDTQAKRLLRTSGYSQLKIVKRSLSKVHVEACKDGKRLYLRLDPQGRLLESNQIGTCRRRVTIDEAFAIMRDKGYRRINIENRARDYIATACLAGQRQRVAISRFGDVAKQRDMGSCRPELSTSDVAALLRQDGYNRITFTDDQLPRYVARACHSGRRVELVLSRRGKIREQLRIGKCDPPIDPARLPALLAKSGFNRIQLINEKPPRYRAEACRGTDRIELVVNRFGKIVDQVSTGRCPPPVNRNQLADALVKQGFKPVLVEADANNTFNVNVCRDGNRIMASFSRYGELLKQSDKGACTLPNLNAIAGEFRSRGLTDANFFIEGCREGRRIRIRLNQFGERVARERLGPC